MHAAQDMAQDAETVTSSDQGQWLMGVNISAITVAIFIVVAGLAARVDVVVAVVVILVSKKIDFINFCHFFLIFLLPNFDQSLAKN